MSQKTSQNKFNEAIERIGEGMSVKNAIEGLFSRKVFYDFLKDSPNNPDFQTNINNYACAREMRTDVMCDELIEIVDDPNIKTIADVQKARLKYEARQWIMSKHAPKNYGDSKQIDLTSDGEKLGVNLIINLSDEKK